MEYLKSRGITDNSVFADFQIGFSNGTLLNTIPDKGDILDSLKEIDILNDKGHEMFYGSAVFPIFDENKDCVGLYGRRITEGETAHLSTCPVPGVASSITRRPRGPNQSSLTESIIDALTLYNAGFKDVIPCYGVNGLTEDHLALFARHQTKEVYICFDKDEAGEQCAERIKEQLKEKSIDAFIVTLPAVDSDEKTDVNFFFLSNPDAAAIFERLLKEASPRASIRSDKAFKHKRKHYEKTEAGFVVQYDRRWYEVRGITKDNSKLKATIKDSLPSSIPAGDQERRSCR
jgi:DNA primase